jgi:signal transduction histidine kinase
MVGFLMLAVSLLIGALTYLPNFWHMWQPALVTLLLFTISDALALMAMTVQRMPTFQNPVARVSWFSEAVLVMITVCVPLRLNFRWAALLNCGITLIGIVWSIKFFDAPLSTVLSVFDLGVSVILITLTFLAFAQERLHRDAFLANWRLAEKEAAERSRRQQTETMLHVLSRAIGGIVHDLGNPLTSVQTGAETMEMFIADGDTDPETLREFLDIITDGARMLNYLRLSLMEETRVLEGKPIPVDLKPVLVRAIVETGVRYQKPKFASGRRIVIEGEDVQLLLDEMKIITVFMNLIGNALKYSDGEVRISWQRHEEALLIAVADQGRGGRGLTAEQASSLFVPFVRLEAHNDIEGTGLGLLSVQKIIEAHGGEIFIAGRDGETSFSTAQAPYPSMLSEGFATAFVIACPFRS